jgi:hypothetical protein
VSKIFLSHASADKPTVRRIAEALRIAGHDPWIDEDVILVGESIPAAIERGLREAEYVVVCLSKAAAERGWVEAERDATVMQQFRSRKARILPVRLEDVSPPYLIGHFRYVDLFPEGAFERGIAELLRAISVHEGAAATPRPTKRAVPNIEGLTPAARQILHEQAFAWEGTFFFQVWLDKWEATSDLRADLTYGVVWGPGSRSMPRN